MRPGWEAPQDAEDLARRLISATPGANVLHQPHWGKLFALGSYEHLSVMIHGDACGQLRAWKITSAEEE